MVLTSHSNTSSPHSNGLPKSKLIPMTRLRSRRGNSNNNRGSIIDRIVTSRHYCAIQTTILVITFMSSMLIWSSMIATQEGATGDDWSWRGQNDDDESDHHPASFEEYKKLPYQSNPQLDSIVAYLMDLAKTPPSDLWDIFGMDDNINNNKSSSSGNNMKNYGKDVFSLQELEQGKCPSNIDTLGWLPPKPWNSEEISSLYQSKVAELKSSNKNKKKMMMRGPAANQQQSTEVILWYEHMSKAGGTTFCGLAKTNLGRDLVPKYYCMPKRLGSKDYDGRVGSWTNDALISYATREAHFIVANEWDPFNIDKLALSGRSLDGQKVPLPKKRKEDVSLPPPRLLFVTTLRDPADRLLSTYLFFRHKENPPEFGQWLKLNQKRIRNFQIGMKGAFRSNVARYNAIVWRYSGGNLRVRLPEEAVVVASEEQKQGINNQNNRFPVPMMDENYWKDPFETAIRALMQLDVILPMDVMTKEEGQETMRRILGWEEVAIKDGRGRGDKDNGHIVTTGKIRNSNAREYLSEEDYKFMWEANWLDNILVLWCRAVFLARLHCIDA